MSELRASDADRDRVIQVLRRHHADGRITSDELEERIGSVWATKYVSGLAAVTADLPEVTAAPAPSGPAPPPQPRWSPGRRFFSTHWRAPTPPGETMLAVLDQISHPLNGAGYGLIERTVDRAVFVHRRFPLWVWPVIVMFFPFGLLALKARKEDRITVELLHQTDGTTLVYAGGVAPHEVRRAFAVLES